MPSYPHDNLPSPELGTSIHLQVRSYGKGSYIFFAASSFASFALALVSPAASSALALPMPAASFALAVASSMKDLVSIAIADVD